MPRTLEIYAKVAYVRENGGMAADYRECTLEEATKHLDTLKRQVTDWPDWSVMDYR